MLGQRSVPHCYRDSTCTFHALGSRSKAALSMNPRACPFPTSPLLPPFFPSDGTRFHRPRAWIWSYPIFPHSPFGSRHLFRVHPTWHPAGPGCPLGLPLETGGVDLAVPHSRSTSFWSDWRLLHRTFSLLIRIRSGWERPWQKGAGKDNSAIDASLDQSEAVVWGGPSGWWEALPFPTGTLPVRKGRCVRSNPR